MIVRTLNGVHYLARQPEHARQSAVIASCLRDEFFAHAGERQEVIRATKRHDDGWNAWESEPECREDGLPLNFPDLSHEVHRANWYRTIDNARKRLSPLAAAVIARHAGKFLQEHGIEIAAAHRELTEELKSEAWPSAGAEARCACLERGFAALFTGDALSLIGVAGWKETHALTLHRPDGSRFEFRAWRDGDWTVRVDPWPFALPGLKAISIEATLVPSGEEARACEILNTGKSSVIPVDYLPLK